MNLPAKAARILVVDDDPDLLDLIAMRLNSAGYAVALAASGEEAIEIFHAEPPRAVVCDLRMDGMDGHELFARLHAIAPSVPVIILTAHGTIPDAVAATQRGVFSFLTKPFDGRELLARVADAVALSPAIAPDREDAGWRRAIVSSSAVMDELLRNARRLADEDVPLLVLGPRGSGKELLARVIHDCGSRAGQPFHVYRSGTALDSGEEESQFSRALAKARGGTLFIDDVGLLSPPLQVRLLALVGGTNAFGTSSSELRIIAASSDNLELQARDGRLRADLYYHLKRNTLAVPGLAERREDIPLLIAHFVETMSKGSPIATGGFTPEAIAMLCEAQWPGNVRQLRTIVETALTQTVVSRVPTSVVSRLLQADIECEMTAFDDARRAFEYDYLARLLMATSGNVAQAARIAQRNRTEFYKLLARHNLDPAPFKQTARKRPNGAPRAS